VKIHKTSHVLIPIWWKNGGDGVLSTMSNLYNVFHCHIIWVIRWKKTMKKNKKQRNEQPWTLVQTLVLQTMKLFLKKIQTNCFPSKLVPFSMNHNLICLQPKPLSKGLGTNLKFFTNGNVQFHWALFLGPLSKMALSLWHHILGLENVAPKKPPLKKRGHQFAIKLQLDFLSYKFGFPFNCVDSNIFDALSCLWYAYFILIIKYW
jgi:hypothetical protein